MDRRYKLGMAALTKKTLTIRKIGDACGVLLPEKDFPFLKTGDLVDVRLGEGRTVVITPLSATEAGEDRSGE